MSVSTTDRRTLRIKDSGGTQITHRVPSVNISKQQNGRDRAHFEELVDNVASASLEVGESVTIRSVDSALSETVIFGGTVERRIPTDLNDKSDKIHIRYDLVDFNRIADRHLVAQVYTNQTLSQVVNDIITTYLTADGVTAGTIATGPTLAKVIFNYIPASQALDELSELTGYLWNIGYTKALDVYERSTNSAPWSITSSGFRYQTMRAEQTREQYRNRQYVRAGLELTDDQTEIFAGDGQRVTFSVGYPVGQEPTIRKDIGAGYVAQTVGILGVETGTDWYWNKESNQILQDTGGTVLGTTHLLEVVYKGLYPIIVTSENTSEIAGRIAVEGGAGVYEHVIDRPNIQESDLALDEAAGQLRRWGTIDKTAIYRTLYPGLEAGQIQRIEVSDLGLSGEFLIDSVDVIENSINEPAYFVRALSGEQVGGWATFFKKLAMSGRAYVIRDNEVIVYLVTLSDAVEVEDTFVTTEHTPGTDFVVGTALVGFSEAL